MIDSAAEKLLFSSDQGGVLYIVPYPRFFSQHKNVGGHVAHAYGITSALANTGFRVQILLDEDIPLMHGHNRMITTVPLVRNTLFRRVMWGKTLVNRVIEIVRKEHPRFCYVRYSVGFQNWLPALKKALGDIPLILEINSFGSQRNRLLSIVEGYYLNHADKLIVISQPVFDALHRFWGEKITQKTMIVPNGVDPDRLSNWKDNASRGYGKVIRAGYAGLMFNWYGLENVIKGFLKARELEPDRNIELHFYGEGPYRKELESRYRKYDSIHFHGAQPFESMPDILGSLDILINSDSRQKSYGSPTKMFEYMSSGRPILSARIAQSEKLLENGKFGWLYEVDNPDSFARSLLDVIHNPEKAREKSLAARQYVENNHSWKHRVDYIINNIGEESRIYRRSGL